MDTKWIGELLDLALRAVKDPALLAAAFACFLGLLLWRYLIPIAADLKAIRLELAAQTDRLEDIEENTGVHTQHGGKEKKAP